MPKKQDEEWTFVSTSRNRGRKNNGSNRNLVKKSGLTRQEKKIAKAQEIQNYLSSESTNNNSHNVVIQNNSNILSNGKLDDSNLGDQEAIVSCILECIDSLESTDFAKRCFHLIHEVASCPRNTGVCEIICYGIGNFSAMPMYSASMLQLAFAILIRKWSSMVDDRPKEHDHNHGYEQNQCNNTYNVSWEDQQKLIKIMYYEPFMNNLERSILENIFHVEILEINERGKRSISTDNNKSTLFFMPHCPMRLYSNVLWANWGDALLRTIIFGNSFYAYDDRTVDSKIRRDPSNSIFRALPFIKEHEWNRLNVDIFPHDANLTTKKTTLASLEDGAALNHLEKAFNDCVVTSFHIKSQTIKGTNNNNVMVWPEQPQEYHFQSDENSHGEVL